jgi:hypothetical protein
MHTIYIKLQSTICAKFPRVSGVNYHPRKTLIQRNTKLIHPVYMYIVTNVYWQIWISLYSVVLTYCTVWCWHTIQCGADILYSVVLTYCTVWCWHILQKNSLIFHWYYIVCMCLYSYQHLISKFLVQKVPVPCIGVCHVWECLTQDMSLNGKGLQFCWIRYLDIRCLYAYSGVR